MTNRRIADRTIQTRLWPAYRFEPLPSTGLRAALPVKPKQNQQVLFIENVALTADRRLQGVKVLPLKRCHPLSVRFVEARLQLAEPIVLDIDQGPPGRL
jgi:hypothetical protein